MSDMKCPFCNLDIRSHRIYLDGCDNTRSPMWQELIKLREENERTRKALDVAVDALKWIAYDENDEQDGLEEFAISQMAKKADEALEQITALEQKD